MPRHVLAEIAAVRYITLAEVSRDKAEATRMRMLELLQNPSERNLEVVEWFLDEGFESLSNDIGGDAALAYYQRVTDFVKLDIKTLHSVPVNERDSAFYDAEAIMLAAAKRQAYIEKGGALDALIMGIEQGEDRKRFLSGKSASEIRGIDYDVKGAIKERAKG